jgi:rod shape determining protein RodA
MGRSTGHGETHKLVNFAHLDFTLLTVIILLALMGLVILYSAVGTQLDPLLQQSIRFAFGLTVLLCIAQIPTNTLRLWSAWFYALSVVLLVWVLLIGDSSGGAQRWLDVGVVRFQPSEIAKLAVPMVLAWFFADKQLPANRISLLIAIVTVILPVILIGMQPDLGTAVLVASTGIFILFFAGICWKWILGLLFTGLASTPVLWHFMHDYQRQRIMTLLHPENDPQGTGYHIIQSKIALGSGGLFGKGWLNGTQSQLDFIPERSTDFIFAVFGEEFGYLGILALSIAYSFIVLRGLMIAARAQDTYSRLLAGGLSMAFFSYFFVNMGMVSGMLPIVGVPLPLISYGGTSMVTLMAAFGILMSIRSHRRLLTR